MLAVAGALSLALIDFIYVSRQVIPPIYLVDGVIELFFLLGWTLAFAVHYLKRDSNTRHEPSNRNG